MTRTITRNGETSTEVQSAITRVPRSAANVQRLRDGCCGYGKIENGLHGDRDMTFGEEASCIRTGEAPQNFSRVRNAAIGLLHSWGVTNIAAALRENALKVDDLLAKRGIL